jgi:hypothetical protein
MDQFGQELGSKTSLGVGSDDYIRNMLVQALGSEKAGNLIDRILLGRNTTGLDALKWMDPRAVADLVRNEHPQIIAIVMAHLETDQAADALKLLPDRTRVDVLLRIATLDGIPPNALNELNEIMERQFAGNQNLKSSNIGGVQCAANILNFMDSGQDQAILGEIARIDAAEQPHPGPDVRVRRSGRPGRPRDAAGAARSERRAPGPGPARRRHQGARQDHPQHVAARGRSCWKTWKPAARCACPTWKARSGDPGHRQAHGR